MSKNNSTKKVVQKVEEKKPETKRMLHEVNFTHPDGDKEARLVDQYSAVGESVEACVLIFYGPETGKNKKGQPMHKEIERVYGVTGFTVKEISFEEVIGK